jgi:uncharacterized protein
MDRLILRVDGRRADAGWPHDDLDVGALMSAGWRPTPLGQFILKVHSRCNLACDYCYVYESPDQGWRRQPGRMTRSTAVRAAERIAQHARNHRLPRVQVILHGGEPLLAGPGFLDFVCSTVRATGAPDVEVDLCVQTNATLLDTTVLDVFATHQVKVGVSLDGLPTLHDRRRPHTGGRGSHTEVHAALDLLREPQYRHLFAGLLCVVDPEADPVETYEQLVAFEPPTIDLLLPHANWSRPPARPHGGSRTPYGDWLIAAFDRWSTAGTYETSVRLFEAILRGLVGLSTRVETIGLSPAVDIVVETDGTIEQVDALKSAYDGAAATGLNVHDHPFDAALLLPPVVARQIGAASLADTCRRCDIHTVCGAGFYPHRYHRGEGFRNPSVYCQDLGRLIRHVRTRLEEDLPPLHIEDANPRDPVRPL